jgi:hypothetical protein
MKINPIETLAFQTTIVYGAPKTGKTRMVGRLAQHYEIDYIDGENGISTFLDSANLDPAYLPNINLFKIPDNGATGQFFTTVYKMLTSKTYPLAICDLHGKVDCASCKKEEATKNNFSSFNPFTRNPNKIIVIDSLSQLTTSCLAFITRDQPDEYKYQLDDWGKLKAYMERIFSVIQAADANIICISHEEVAEFEDGKKRIVPVGGSSKTSTTVAKNFDNVVYCESQGIIFKATSTSGKVPNVITGSRANRATESVSSSKLYSPLQSIYTKGII